MARTLEIRDTDAAMFVATALNYRLVNAGGGYSPRQRRSAQRLVDEAFAIAYDFAGQDDAAASGDPRPAA